MQYKEKPFISVVIYFKNDENIVTSTLSALYHLLTNHFEKWELILVDDCSEDKTYCKLVETIKNFSGSVSILRLSRPHGKEMALFAGLDKSVGDFVYELETAIIDYEITLLLEMFMHSKKGHDIVTLSPTKKENFFSKIFYKLFNANSILPVTITTQRVALMSRRALNNLLSITERIRYRKALLTILGLNSMQIYFSPINGDFKVKESLSERFVTALFLLLTYTNLGLKLSITSAIFFLVFSIAVCIYTLISFFILKNTVSGWTSIILLTTFSFSGLFLLQTIIVQYLSKINQEIVRLPYYVISKQYSQHD